MNFQIKSNSTWLNSIANVIAFLKFRCYYCIQRFELFNALRRIECLFFALLARKLIKKLNIL